MSTLLIISSQAPYFSSCAQDAIEAALAASNVGIKVTYVFSQQGIFQLVVDQNSVMIGKKSLLKQIRVLPLYDIENIYYIKEDADDLRLSTSDIGEEIQALSLEAFNLLCDSFDAVLRF